MVTKIIYCDVNKLKKFKTIFRYAQYSWKLIIINEPKLKFSKWLMKINFRNGNVLQEN